METTSPKTRGNAIMRRTSRPRKPRGVAAAELAVCLPIVVLMVLGTIEACSALFLKQSLTAAAYEGVRTAITPTATSSAVQASCNQILADRKIKNATVTIKPTAFANLKPGEFVAITVSAPCASNSLVPVTFYRGRTLTATATMMIEN
ncbi:MAG TPA: TadE family protein [Lacipirellulaceae bacterium]|jgi:Flp pilus assembly protein TadG|nr:TadE family protein [Lacipirellulaceae bacterium]